MRYMYAIYDNTDMVQFVGDIFECAKFLDTSESVVRSIISRTKNGFRKGKTVMIYKVEEDEDE